MSYYGFFDFNDSAYQVVDGNIVYASDLNNPMAALETGISSLVASIQTGATIKTATDTGTVNAYVMSLTAAPTALTDGLEVWLKPSVANTGPATLNLNDLGAKAIRSTLRTALAGGELVAGYPFLLKYVLSIDSWLIVSDPGSTELDTTRTLTGGDGITITSDADSILVEITDGGIETAKMADDAVTADKIADGAVTQDKIASLPDMVHNDIIGGDITKTGANELTLTAVSCWDSTRTVWMEKSTATVVAIPAVANTLYQLAEVRLVAGGSITVQAYATEAAIAADATINAYRWIGEWLTNGATECVEGVMTDGVMVRGKASECVLSTGVTTSYATVDHSAQITESRVAEILYGVRDSITAYCLASTDGTNVSYFVGYTDNNLSDTTLNAFGVADWDSSTQPFWSSMQFKSNTGTIDLLVHKIRYRR